MHPSPISILIAFRNEEEHLSTLLDCLSKQQYESGKLELILVDDHSTDRGFSIIEQRRGSFPFPLQLLQLADQSGKKAAIIKGVKASSGELILCTDADCSFEPKWVKSFDELYRASEAAMICGAVVMQSSNSFLAYWQSVEQAILTLLTRKSIFRRRAILANGANMAFQKKLFKSEFLATSSTNSGDDTFLLQALKSSYPKQIVYNSSEDGKVFTNPKSRWKDFFHQRLRWASKSKYYRDKDVLFFGSLVFLSNLILLLFFLSSLIGGISWQCFFAFFGIKLLADALIFISANKKLGLLKKASGLIIFSFFYPIYSIAIALLSLLFKPKWKGRSI